MPFVRRADWACVCRAHLPTGTGASERAYKFIPSPPALVGAHSCANSAAKLIISYCRLLVPSSSITAPPESVPLGQLAGPPSDFLWPPFALAPKVAKLDRKQAGRLTGVWIWWQVGASWQQVHWRQMDWEAELRNGQEVGRVGDSLVSGGRTGQVGASGDRMMHIVWPAGPLGSPEIGLGAHLAPRSCPFGAQNE